MLLISIVHASKIKAVFDLVRVFLILAAWAASKGWPQMDAWLLNHPKYGATLRNWRECGTVPRKAKWIASIMMLISGVLMLFTNAPILVKVFTDVTMLIVAIWLWSRPEPDSKND
ncbi:YbaN family protein [Acinetobacter junii]|uniref:YbaN family protein n=1 Tax=Acinetobacter junii TaxID=40215 RepID=UPI001D0DA195|nr:YbaN family protein [Acinetobacter junii]